MARVSLLKGASNFSLERRIMNSLKLSLLASLAMVGAASATTINGTSLQTVLNNITTGGVSSVDVQNDQILQDKYWALTATGGSVATMIIEIAGYAGSNTFGVFDAANPSNKVTLFNGPAVGGDQVTLSIKATGAVYVNNVATGVTFSAVNFGYFLQGPGGTFYSDNALNGDAADHMVSFQGKDDEVTLPGNYPGLWTPNEYVLGWEDVAYGDNDFDDMVVMVESVRPVPEPTTLGLMGLGLLSLGLLARRKKTA
jgi:hypothetical protein